MKEIEIPFGAKDSELKGWEYTIPEGMEAEIKDGKIVVREKESEDERIRKFLIKLVNDGLTSFPDSLTRSDVLAYLEKQKEQKPIQTEDEKEYVRTLKSLIADFLRGKEEVDRSYYQKIYDWLDGRHIEQKPEERFEEAREKSVEWSEEDEKMRLDTISAFYLAYPYALESENPRKKNIDWLKSLPERFNLQPKQEWDTYDKAEVICIACCLDGQFVTEAARKEALEWFNKHRRDFLNSSSWKPSNEQMGALYDSIEWEGERAEDVDFILKSLYNDLKKLM